MPEFRTIKGTLKLRELAAIEVLSERLGENIYLHLEVKLRDGRTRQIGGIRLFNEQEPHPRRHLLTFKLPEESAWRSKTPDELTINFGVVKATWKKSKD